MTLPILLGPGDPLPVRVLNPDAQVPLLLLCDHASNTIPASLCSLGLSQQDLVRHIAWDIGAEAVTRALSVRLGATTVMTSFSRLVLDCNRSLDDPSLMALQSDGTVIPGNSALSTDDRTARIQALHRPYHDQIDSVLEAFIARGQFPVLVGIHSFTPTMNGIDRPWQIGVLWDKDPRMPLPLLRTLAAEGLVVGDNLPYSARSPFDYTMPRHAAARGLAHTVLEIRQNEIDTPEGASHYAACIARALAPVLADDALYRTH